MTSTVRNEAKPSENKKTRVRKKQHLILIISGVVSIKSSQQVKTVLLESLRSHNRHHVKQFSTGRKNITNTNIFLN